jgi:hypothetical protein
VVLIEYDAQAPLFYEGDTSASPSASATSGSAAAGPGGGMGMGGGTPSQEHIHTTIRTPNGGDYGIDLLKPHLEQDHWRRRRFARTIDAQEVRFYGPVRSSDR